MDKISWLISNGADVNNYKNNFLIPIALSGDRSYNKDNVRRFIDNEFLNYSTDYTITMIISEEMPAYFDGQKSLNK